MKKPLINILKLFFLDWVVTGAMYLVGLFFSGMDNLEKADVIFYISNLSSSPTGTSPLLDVFTYLFASIAFVVLISFLINKSYIKYPKKTFILSQLFYLISVVIVVFSIPFFV